MLRAGGGHRSRNGGSEGWSSSTQGLLDWRVSLVITRDFAKPGTCLLRLFAGGRSPPSMEEQEAARAGFGTKRVLQQRLLRSLRNSGSSCCGGPGAGCARGASQREQTAWERVGSCAESPQQGSTGGTVRRCHTALFWRRQSVGTGGTGVKENTMNQLSILCSPNGRRNHFLQVSYPEILISSPTLTPWYSASYVPDTALGAVVTCSPPSRNLSASSSFHNRKVSWALHLCPP